MARSDISIDDEFTSDEKIIDRPLERRKSFLANLIPLIGERLRRRAQKPPQ